MKKFVFLLVILLFFGLISPVSAVENNKFGIHVTQTEDLTKAAELVNTNNGDWGYVTIVIQENDRSREKWQDFFGRILTLRILTLRYSLLQLLQGEYRQAPSWRMSRSSAEGGVAKQAYRNLSAKPNLSFTM